jgi:hypothetical protein
MIQKQMERHNQGKKRSRSESPETSKSTFQKRGRVRSHSLSDSVDVPLEENPQKETCECECEHEGEHESDHESDHESEPGQATVKAPLVTAEQLLGAMHHHKDLITELEKSKHLLSEVKNGYHLSCDYVQEAFPICKSFLSKFTRCFPWDIENPYTQTVANVLDLANGFGMCDLLKDTKILTPKILQEWMQKTLEWMYFQWSCIEDKDVGKWFFELCHAHRNEFPIFFQETDRQKELFDGFLTIQDWVGCWIVLQWVVRNVTIVIE